MTEKSVAERLEALEAENKRLADEIAALRPPPAPQMLRPPPLGPAWRSDGENVGVNYSGEPPEGNTSTAGGSFGGFGSPWRKRPDGTRYFAPDGVERDPISGEAIDRTRRRVLRDEDLPRHSAAVEDVIRYADRALPIGPDK